jgi:integrase
MATLRRIDASWILDWRDGQGKRHRDTLGRCDTLPEREAKRILKQRNLELAAGFRILNPEAAPTFGHFIADYLSWHAAEYPSSHYRTAQIVTQHLLPEFEYVALDAFNPHQVDAWKHRRMALGENRHKAETVAKELRTLKAIFAKAVEWKAIREHPIPYVAAPLSLDSKPPLFFTQAELNAIYAACSVEVNAGEGPQPNPLHAAIWRLYANTGMRRGEGLMLKRAWIGQEAMKILSTDEQRTKSGSGARFRLPRVRRLLWKNCPKAANT